MVNYFKNKRYVEGVSAAVRGILKEINDEK
jgi:hypothetical protein